MTDKGEKIAFVDAKTNLKVYFCGDEFCVYYPDGSYTIYQISVPKVINSKLIFGDNASVDGGFPSMYRLIYARCEGAPKP